MRNLSIRKKLLFIVLGAIIAVYLLIFAFNSYNVYNNSIDKAKQLANSESAKKALLVQSLLSEDMSIARGMSYALDGIELMDDSTRRVLIDRLLLSTLLDNEKYEATWLSLQLKYIDPSWNEDYGREYTSFYKDKKDKSDIKKVNERKELDGFLEGSTYLRLSQEKVEEFGDPYPYDNFSGGSRDMSSLGSSSTVPILVDGKFAGLIGADFPLTEFREMSAFTAFDHSHAFVISNDAKILTAVNKKSAGKLYTELSFLKEINITDLITLNQGFNGSIVDEKDGKEYYISIVPFRIGRTERTWLSGVVIPMSEISKDFNENLYMTMTAAIAGLLALFFIIYYFAKWISKNIKGASELLENLAKGKRLQRKSKKRYSKDEIGIMFRSVDILNQELMKKADFSTEIGDGNLEAEYEVSNKEDMLGNALIKMRDNLRESKVEDTKRRWINEGLAKFGVLLQSQDRDLQTFCDEIISELVKYVRMNQGGLFIFDDENGEEKLKLMGTYAFERKKYLEKTLALGQGLVGQAYLEKEHIYLKEVPENYVNITSGLGEATPNYVLIMPLMINNDVYGVVEMASFKPIPDFEIEFVKTVGESIASNIANVKIGERTKRLLEESQQNSEELRAQEEEMRQNMEELEATQEELDRKNKETDTMVRDLNQWQHNVKAILDGAYYGILVADMQGVIQDCNAATVRLLNRTKDQIEGVSISSILVKDDFKRLPENEISEIELLNRAGVAEAFYAAKTMINKVNGDHVMFLLSKRE